MHENLNRPSKRRAPVIREDNENQLSLAGFEWPFHKELDSENRWVKLAAVIPWDAMSEVYHQRLKSTLGRPAKSARLVIGAMIIKHKLVLSDRETVDQLSENPYLQYFVGLKSYQTAKVFDASLFVLIRRRMGQQVFDAFQQIIVDEVERVDTPDKMSAEDQSDDHDSTGPSEGGNQDDTPLNTQEETPALNPQGRLILDATVADQSIRYPTDVSLLNEAREFTEQIIDALYAASPLKKKPRTYREKARKEYLSVAKKRRCSARVIRKAIRQQLQYLRRNLGHIQCLLGYFEEGTALPLANWLLRRYWVIPHLYDQQYEMYTSKSKRCSDRIVSISQPWVRPIVRGKQHKSTEFGAKINVSLDEHGLARVDRHSWDAYHEGNDLKGQVEAYRERYGCYPEVVMADPAYGTRDNRAYLKELDIRFGGKPLGRPRKKTPENAEQLKAEKKQRQEDYRQRIPIEGKFGQGKGGYRLNYIRAKRSDTSISWVNAIFMVMNLLVLYEYIFWSVKRVSNWRRWLDCIAGACVTQISFRRNLGGRNTRKTPNQYAC